MGAGCKALAPAKFAAAYPKSLDFRFRTFMSLSSLGASRHAWFTYFEFFSNIQQWVIPGEPLSLAAHILFMWHPVRSAEFAVEPPTRLTSEIDPEPNGLVRLTLIDEVGGAPMVAAVTTGDISNAGGGWPFVLSDLKTQLETGKALGDG